MRQIGQIDQFTEVLIQGDYQSLLCNCQCQDVSIAHPRVKIAHRDGIVSGILEPALDTLPHADIDQKLHFRKSGSRNWKEALFCKTLRGIELGRAEVFQG